MSFPFSVGDSQIAVMMRGLVRADNAGGEWTPGVTPPAGVGLSWFGRQPVRATQFVFSLANMRAK
jgi:hypothetical protein